MGVCPQTMTIHSELSFIATKKDCKINSYWNSDELRFYIFGGYLKNHSKDLPLNQNNQGNFITDDPPNICMKGFFWFQKKHPASKASFLFMQILRMGCDGCDVNFQSFPEDGWIVWKVFFFKKGADPLFFSSGFRKVNIRSLPKKMARNIPSCHVL